MPAVTFRAKPIHMNTVAWRKVIACMPALHFRYQEPGWSSHFTHISELSDTAGINKNFTFFSDSTQFLILQQLVYDFSSYPQILGSLRNTYQIRQLIVG